MMRSIRFACLILVLGSAAAFSQTTEEKSCAVSADCRIRIANVAGSVDVVGWDQNEISLRANLGPDVERLDFICNDSTATIEVVVPHSGNKRIESTLVISVPKGSSLEVETVSADCRVRDVFGEMNVTTVSGDAKVENTQGTVRVRSVSGDIFITGNSASMTVNSVSGKVEVSATAGEISLETISGSINVAGTMESMRAKSVSGSITLAGSTSAARTETISGDARLEKVVSDVECHSVSGDMRIVGEALVNGRFETTSGDVEYTGDLAEKGYLRGISQSGSITIRTSENPNVMYDLVTNSGDIDTFLGVEPQRRQEHGPGMKLQSGAPGAASVIVNTNSGDIEIERK